jgi:hypothetical protein
VGPGPGDREFESYVLQNKPAVDRDRAAVTASPDGIVLPGPRTPADWDCQSEAQ